MKITIDKLVLSWYDCSMIRVEDNLSRWVKTTVSFEIFKELKKLAIDEDTSLAELLRRAIRDFLNSKE